MGKEFVEEVLADAQTSRLDLPHKELFRYLDKLAESSTHLTAEDIHRLKEVGWSEEAIYDALTVAALFQFYNTWINGSGVRSLSSAEYLSSGSRLRAIGYCMDFNFIGILKVLWTACKELSCRARPIKWANNADRFRLPTNNPE